MNEHFYHQLTKKYIAAFATLFNDITLKRYNKAHTTEIKRLKVPLVYEPREKYIVRAGMDHDLAKKIQASFPMMSFNLVGMQYFPARQTNQVLRHPKLSEVDGKADSVYNGVPYNLGFELSIHARNKDDAWQILEQIIPVFNPTFTFSQILIPEIGFVKDIPVTLDSINSIMEYGGDFDEINTVEILLNFSMKVYYYGPVSRTSYIKRVFANTFIDPSLASGAIVRANMSNGNNGAYYLDDLVYQGATLSEATAAGVVTKWDGVDYLVIGGTQGRFTTNNVVRAASTNAAYTLESFDVTPLKVQSIQIDPDPITANANSEFGFTETVTEYPETIEN